MSRRGNERGVPATSLFPTSAQLEAIERTRAAYDSALAKVDEHLAAARGGLTPEQAEAQRAFAAACGGLPTPAEYTAQREAKRERLGKYHAEQARRRRAAIESFARAMGGA